VATKPAATQQLYDSDFALWLDEQARALKERCAAALDWDNLAEEIEGLARSDRRALRSYLQNALLHLLELAYWDAERERNQRQWRQHLINARNAMAIILEDSPSLERYLAEVFGRTYEVARREAENLIGLPLPQNCEWTLQQVRDDTFYPEPAIPPC
jgi:hypothetical protein